MERASSLEKISKQSHASYTQVLAMYGVCTQSGYILDFRGWSLHHPPIILWQELSCNKSDKMVFITQSTKKALATSGKGQTNNVHSDFLPCFCKDLRKTREPQGLFWVWCGTSVWGHLGHWFSHLHLPVKQKTTSKTFYASIDWQTHLADNLHTYNIVTMQINDH